MTFELIVSNYCVINAPVFFKNFYFFWKHNNELARMFFMMHSFEEIG